MQLWPQFQALDQTSRTYQAAPAARSPNTWWWAATGTTGQFRRLREPALAGRTVLAQPGFHLTLIQRTVIAVEPVPVPDHAPGVRGGVQPPLRIGWLCFAG